MLNGRINPFTYLGFADVRNVRADHKQDVFNSQLESIWEWFEDVQL